MVNMISVPHVPGWTFQSTNQIWQVSTLCQV